MTPHYKSLRSAYPIFAHVFGSYRFPTEGFGRRKLVSSKISAGEEDFTVGYLVKSCGLSPEASIVASHKVKLRSLEKPDSVVALLRDYELSHTQISSVVRRLPRILLSDTQKTLIPKLEFFCSIGLSMLDLAITLSLYPCLLKPSLKNQLIPNYNFLKRVMVSDVKVQNILKRYPRSFQDNLSKNVIPNIGILRELGMPQSSIAVLLAQ